jgi:hypothetical protein
MRRHRTACLLLSIAGASSAPMAEAAILFETYNSRSAFEARLGGNPSVIDFEDIDTSVIDPRQFSTDRYRDSTGAIIRGETDEGQYASRSFGFPSDFPPTSGVNIYAPGPVGLVVGTNTTTLVTFLSGGQPAAVTGFGAVFIDADFPGLGPSSLSVFDLEDSFLATTGTISGGNASQLFRGIVAVDDATDTPTPVIGLVELVSGNAWPTVETFDSEGVVLDDFVFSTVPEPLQGLLSAAVLLSLASLRSLRRQDGTARGQRQGRPRRSPAPSSRPAW